MITKRNSSMQTKKLLLLMLNIVLFTSCVVKEKNEENVYGKITAIQTNHYEDSSLQVKSVNIPARIYFTLSLHNPTVDTFFLPVNDRIEQKYKSCFKGIITNDTFNLYQILNVEENYLFPSDTVFIICALNLTDKYGNTFISAKQLTSIADSIRIIYTSQKENMQLRIPFLNKLEIHKPNGIKLVYRDPNNREISEWP